MTYRFHIRTPTTAGVQVEATVAIDDNRPDFTEELRKSLAEFYRVPTMWVMTPSEYGPNDLSRCLDLFMDR
jgi:hypothetical protein